MPVFPYFLAKLIPSLLGLDDILQPITDASHTRDRKRSPPDSACFPGTRLQVVKNINTWARTDITTGSEPHIRWMHGYVGSGKSSISQEVCDTSEREDRPVISFFFFRNAGDRSRIWRLATTLASQMAAVIPQTEPFIREAVQANPALVTPNEGGVSLRTRMQRLVYAPFKAVVQRKKRVRALIQDPFLVVLDGLDECGNKDEVQELIDGMLVFFNENPLIPLRVFITSRVEEHIQSRLNVPAVILDNLVDHCSDDDIATFLDILFEDGCRRSSVVRAYVRQNGEWPTQSDRRKLVQHIGGSFIFASAVFKFIMATNAEGGPPTPMDRLPLALKMNPGLDGLYTQTLARSIHLPHFSNIISTIALLFSPLPTSGIADLLGIQTYEVVNVLVNLQAIIQVPGTDDIPVTLCHTSLRDFLTTESRSRNFFARPSHHVRLFLRCLECKLKHLRQNSRLFIRSSEEIPVSAHYALGYSIHHLEDGLGSLKLTEFDCAIRFCREAVALRPGTPRLIGVLANTVLNRGSQTGSLTDLDEAISLHREILEHSPSPHPDRSFSLECLGNALLERHKQTRSMADLEEAVSLYRKSLELRPSPDPARSYSLYSLGNALLGLHDSTEFMADLQEAISLYREALNLLPSPHSDRSFSLVNLGNALLKRHRRTGITADAEEGISLLREAHELQSSHPNRSHLLNSLGNALLDRHWRTGIMTDLEDVISLYREALELRPPPHPDRSYSLNNLSIALMDRHRRTGSMANLEEAISLLREALELGPSSHPSRSIALENLIISLQLMYKDTETLSHLQEAIAHCEGLLAFHRPVGHRNRDKCLHLLASLLQLRYAATGQEDDLSKISTLEEEANRLSALSTEPIP
ncbi:hypothetical protein H1R20_g1108, partial [Candolleomyces eurysporus]